MTAIREKVDLEIASKYINEQKVDIFTEEVPIKDLSKTLKREMLYIMDGMKDKNKPKDYDEDDLNFLADDKGNVKGFHYIRADLSDGESKKYIYDERMDVIYKVKGTNILGTTLHTYEYACKLKGVSFRKVNNNADYIINQEAQLVKKGDIAYYEPDLENFRTGVLSIVYYKKDNPNETKEVPYYLSGKSGEVAIDKGLLGGEETYVWYDYSKESKMWANVKCESANELTSYWTWIPRYAYKITGREVDGDGKETKAGTVDIKFIRTDNKYYDKTSNSYKELETGYTVAASFEQGGQHLKGIWMAKYEPSQETLGYKPSTDKEAVNEPDLSNFNKDKTYYVTYGADGKGEEVLTSIKEEAPANWYDYTATDGTSKKWANIKCINTTDGKDLTSYWVWIPRYAYRVEQSQVQIIYIDTENRPLDKKYEGLFTIGTDNNSDFKVLEGFEQGGQHLKGIWMAKYEPSHETVDGFYLSDVEASANAPDLSGFDENTTYYIKYGEDGTGTEEATLVKGNSAPNNWYDYTTKKWANIKTTANGIESYWTWIPRYASRLTQGQLEIIFIGTDNKPLDTKYSKYTIGTDNNCQFRVQASFEQDGQSLSGIWVSKYEPSMVSNEFSNSTIATAINEPDLSGFNKEKTYYITYGDNGNGTEEATLVKGNSAPNNWYDYTTKKWANIKTTANGIESYWTWIPSYAYRVTQGQVEIIFITYDSTNGKWVACDSKYSSCTIGTENSSQYRVLPAFEQNNQHLNGIWVSKYEPSKINK